VDEREPEEGSVSRDESGGVNQPFGFILTGRWAGLAVTATTHVLGLGGGA
jgi:hypothetical protein